MQSKDFRRVGGRKAVDVLMELKDLITLGNTVAFVENKVWLEHKVSKPDSTECIQQTLVIVVCDTSTILDLSKHVVNSNPSDTLQELKVYIWDILYI